MDSCPSSLDTSSRGETLLKKIHRERIPQPVAHHVAFIRNLRGLKEWRNVILGPNLSYAFLFALADELRRI